MGQQPAETEFVSGKRVACDGGGGALGHPRVYLEMGADAQVECPYCGKLFVLEGHEPKSTAEHLAS